MQQVTYCCGDECDSHNGNGRVCEITTAENAIICGLRKPGLVQNILNELPPQEARVLSRILQTISLFCATVRDSAPPTESPCF